VDFLDGLPNDDKEIRFQYAINSHIPEEMMKMVKESTGLINQEEVDCPLRELFQYNKNCEVDRENNKGLLAPSLYVGSPGSLFVLHKEDHALFSVNTCYHGKLTLNFINHERKEPILNFTGEKYWCSFDPSYNY